jgi:hypothetical protein
VITKTHVRIELAIITSSKERNKEYFKKLFVNKEAIEQSFGDTIVWEELPESKMSRIRYDLLDVNYYDENQWDKMNQVISKVEQSILNYKSELLALKD